MEEERDRADALAEVASARPRHPRRRPSSTSPANAVPPAYGGTEPAFAPEALDAHAAGAHDVTDAMTPPAALVEAEQEERIEQAEAVAAAQAVEDATPEPEPVERDHHRRTKVRFNPPETEEGYAVSSADQARAEAPEAPDAETRDAETAVLMIVPGAPDAETTAETATVPDAPEAATAAAPVTGPAAAPVEKQADRVPDVPVLPEPHDRGPVPEQSGLSRLGRAADDAKRDRLENHPFNDEERAAAGNAWPAPAVRERLATADTPDDARRGQPPLRKPLAPRGPAAGLIGLVLMALLAAFFSWVSAEPFWLAVGHGDRGVATVGQCVGSGVTQRCQGSFAAADGSYMIEQVTLLGVDANSRNTGAVAPARMVSPESRQAYVGAAGLLLHLRWTLGFVLVVLCGYGIAGMTGARRLETARARRNAVLISLAGPVLLLFGFLAAAY
jgi:hypothetical protein